MAISSGLLMAIAYATGLPAHLMSLLQSDLFDYVSSFFYCPTIKSLVIGICVLRHYNVYL